MIKTVFQSVCSLSRQNPAFRPLSGGFILSRRLCDTVRDSGAINDGNAEVKTSPKVLTSLQRRHEEAKFFMENLNEDMKQKKAMIEVEYDVLKTSTLQVPEQINAYHWKLLLTERMSTSRRIKYFKYLRKTEINIMADKEKKARKAAERLEKSKIEINPFQFSIHWDDRTHYQRKFNIVRSLTQGSPIVIDLDYEQNRREINNALQQLKLCYGLNLDHPEPFHIHMTGLEHSPDVLAETEPGGSMENLFVDFHKCSFMDLFPRDRLVYLTPDGPMLNDYNGDDIYVIGGLVDLVDSSPRSRTKAKQLGIRYGSFPVKRHMLLNRTSTLTLDAVLKIMLDVNVNHDWRGALYRNIPNRFYQDVTCNRKSNDRRQFSKAQREYQHI